MAAICVTVEPPTDLQPLIRAAYLDGQLVSEFRAAIESGRPVYEEELYGRRHFHEVADELQSLIEMLRSVGARFTILVDGFETDPDVVFNMLAEVRQQFRPPLT